jgi:hypothetical protein
MGEQQWSAKVRPKLLPRAQWLVDIYEATPGSTGPGCCPEALAAVIDEIANYHEQGLLSLKTHRWLASALRGEQP